jgi:hypothetical protein
VQELSELQRQGMSIQAISKLTGWDRKTVRKYLLQPKTRCLAAVWVLKSLLVTKKELLMLPP